MHRGNERVKPEKVKDTRRLRERRTEKKKLGT